MVFDWRGRFGIAIQARGSLLVGRPNLFTAGLIGPFLPFTGLFAFVPNLPVPARIFGIVLFVTHLLVVGRTERVSVDLATGGVEIRRGLFGVAHQRAFVRPQIDGAFMTIREDPRHPRRVFCAIGLQAGLERFTLYRTMDGERGVAFYRHLKDATGYPGIEGF